MIVARLSDGVGNQLFQYACARALSLARDQPLALDPCFFAAQRRRPLLLPHFHTAGQMLEPLGIRRGNTIDYGVKLPRGIRVFREAPLGFKPELARLEDEHVLLCGYFQSEKYFHAVAAVIRADLRFRDLPHDAEVAALEARVAGDASVSVHVRRTDYVGRGRFDVLTMGYFERAMARCRALVPGARFFVFSDDLEFCRAQPLFAGAELVATAAARDNPLVDMRLMSLCRHHIIANSSFSWWGAWLDPRPDKLVLAPAMWFRPAAEPPIDDVLPPEWLRVEP
jgi:hypothetical protein